ncbi:response regulator transcription factor [Lysobacter antibioticus]|uniref:response regulator transcription factor n=1 Tax=Lysobacter antibioticus TaxID=84531 RepID=UPI00068F89A3|nr:response regulator transcription factor [Lysobacter antibioticus]
MGDDSLPLSILIADDHPIIIVALAEMIKAAFGEHRVLVGSVTGSDALLFRLQAEVWRCLVLDLHMPGRLNSAPLLQAVLTQLPDLQVVIYTGSEQPFLAQTLMELGARGFVSKASGPEVAIEAINAVIAGGRYVDPAIDLDVAAKHPWRQLTSGERAVIISLARGENLQAIAIDSNRSYKTVAFHKYNAFRKLGLKSKDEIGKYLVQHGLDYLL